MKSVNKIVGALSIGALASLGCASKEEKPAETDSSKSGTASSCSATKPAEGDKKPAGGSKK